MKTMEKPPPTAEKEQTPQGFVEIEKRDGTAVVWLDQKGEKLNKISVDLLDDFRRLLDQLENDDSIRAAILISRKPDNFIAGADIERFLEMTEPGQAERLSRDGNALLGRMASCAKPIVAAINGAALGGGLEVALACHYRIATDDPKTVLGLPEVQLGLLPGGGGTQRIPRLVGLQRGLDLLLTGKNVYPYPARKMGLVDTVIHKSGLLDASLKIARELAGGKPRKRRKRSLLEKLLEGNPIGRALVFRAARKMVMKKTQGNYPAPLKIIECVRIGMSQGMKAGLKAESKEFDYLMRTPECRELIHLFFGITAAKKNPLADEARKVERIGILGAGLMGSGIADVSAARGIEVFLKDVDRNGLAKAQQAVWEGLSRKVRKRAISSFERDRIFSRIHPTTDYRSLRTADLVVEAVFEDLELKRRVLRETEAVIPERCIFATNTSSLPIGEIAAASTRPEQVIGMHYFSPVPKMPLLELIVTDQTADWVRATALETGIRQGKTTIVVKDGPGFYTTRILAPLLNEAILLLEEGAAVEAVDKAMRRFGFPVGPVALMDEVGLDVGAHVTEVLSGMFSKRGLTPHNKAKELVEAGYRGRKNKSGFYRYDGGKKKQVNSAVYAHFGGPRRKQVKAEEIQERLSLVMMNEAFLCLQEGILEIPKDGDLGAVLGLGFPPFLGGPFRYADRLGADKVVEKLKTWEQQHGARFTPAEILKSTRRFYE